jgi:hypothetical protein
LQSFSDSKNLYHSMKKRSSAIFGWKTSGIYIKSMFKTRK